MGISNGVTLEEPSAAQFSGPTQQESAAVLPRSFLKSLTPERRQLAGLVAQGYTDKAVSQELHILPSAATSHVSLLFLEARRAAHQTFKRKDLTRALRSAIEAEAAGLPEEPVAPNPVTIRASKKVAKVAQPETVEAPQPAPEPIPAPEPTPAPVQTAVEAPKPRQKPASLKRDKVVKPAIPAARTQQAAPRASATSHAQKDDTQNGWHEAAGKILRSVRDEKHKTILDIIRVVKKGTMKSAFAGIHLDPKGMNPNSALKISTWERAENGDQALAPTTYRNLWKITSTVHHIKPDSSQAKQMHQLLKIPARTG